MSAKALARDKEARQAMAKGTMKKEGQTRMADRDERTLYCRFEKGEDDGNEHLPTTEKEIQKLHPDIKQVRIDETVL